MNSKNMIFTIGNNLKINGENKFEPPLNGNSGDVLASNTNNQKNTRLISK